MTTVKALDELTLADLWRVVPHDEDFWEGTKPRLQTMLKHLMQGALEEELTVLLGAGRYRRVDWRGGYRNGFYERDLVTQIGIIQGVRVPRARGVHQERAVFERCQRRQTEVNQLIRDVFLRGVSTRQVGRVLEAMLGERVSAATVSRVARSLDGEVRQFHRQPLSDTWRYLCLDGVYLRVKAAPTVRRRLVLCAFAIGVDGRRRLLDFRLAESESEVCWSAFLSDLLARGLTGQHLKLVATDGCTGLHAALQAVFPYIPRQHCWAHKLRNVSNLLKRSQQQACLSGARRIYQAPTRRAAVAAYWVWARRWRAEAPRAVACLERDLEELLAHFVCPPADRRAVRTTNAIERCFREVRRRTRPMSCFTNDASCERIIYAVFSHLNHTWEARPSQSTQTE
jgi:transposase-like protein